MQCRICRKPINRKLGHSYIPYRASTGRVMFARWHNECERAEPGALAPIYAHAENSENAYRYQNNIDTPSLGVEQNPYCKAKE